MYIDIYIYISVAKPYGRFGQKLESLQAGQERTGQLKTGQGKTWQDRVGVGGHIKSGQSKSRAGRGQKAGQGMMGIVQYG